jgi:hypothetical protein
VVLNLFSCPQFSSWLELWSKHAHGQTTNVLYNNKARWSHISDHTRSLNPNPNPKFLGVLGCCCKIVRKQQDTRYNWGAQLEIEFYINFQNVRKQQDTWYNWGALIQWHAALLVWHSLQLVMNKWSSTQHKVWMWVDKKYIFPLSSKSIADLCG